MAESANGDCIMSTGAGSSSPVAAARRYGIPRLADERLHRLRKGKLHCGSTRFRKKEIKAELRRLVDVSPDEAASAVICRG